MIDIENFDDASKTVLIDADFAVKDMGHWEMEPIHLFYALSQSKDTQCQAVFRALQVQPCELKDSILTVHPLGAGRLLSGKMPRTRAADDALIKALEITEPPNSVASPICILISLLREKHSGLCEVLDQLGHDSDEFEAKALEQCRAS